MKNSLISVMRQKRKLDSKKTLEKHIRIKLPFRYKEDSVCVIDASNHDVDVRNQVLSWGKEKDDKKRRLVVKVQGLTMEQQYGIAKMIRAEIPNGKERQMITVYDGPYKESAQIIERYIRKND